MPQLSQQGGFLSGYPWLTFSPFLVLPSCVRGARCLYLGCREGKRESVLLSGGVGACSVGDPHAPGVLLQRPSKPRQVPYGGSHGAAPSKLPPAEGTARPFHRDWGKSGFQRQWSEGVQVTFRTHRVNLRSKLKITNARLQVELCDVSACLIFQAACNAKCLFFSKKN